MCLRFSRILLFCLTMILVPACSAALVTFQFNMTVTETDIVGEPVGSTIRGSYSFDSNAVNQATSPNYGLYSLTALDVTFLGKRYDATSGVIRIENDAYPDGNTDAYVVLSDFGPYGPYETLHNFYITYYDKTGALFSTNSLPLMPPITSGLTGSALVNAMGGGGGLVVVNGIDKLSLSQSGGTSVPEPASQFLLAIGAISWLSLRHTRYRQS